MLSSILAHCRYELHLWRNAGELAQTIIREILSLSLRDGLQNQAGHEFGLVSFGVIG
jgi:hypothetical protein